MDYYYVCWLAEKACCSEEEALLFLFYDDQIDRYCLDLESPYEEWLAEVCNTSQAVISRLLFARDGIDRKRCEMLSRKIKKLEKKLKNKK